MPEDREEGDPADHVVDLGTHLATASPLVEIDLHALRASAGYCR